MLNAKSAHTSILYLLEEYKATPVVEVVEEEIILPTSQVKFYSNSILYFICLILVKRRYKN